MNFKKYDAWIATNKEWFDYLIAENLRLAVLSIGCWVMLFVTLWGFHFGVNAL